MGLHPVTGSRFSTKKGAAPTGALSVRQRLRDRSHCYNATAFTMAETDSQLGRAHTNIPIVLNDPDTMYGHEQSTLGAYEFVDADACVGCSLSQ